jgi:hypothetical protein
MLPFLVLVLRPPRASHCVEPRESEDQEASVSQRMSVMKRKIASARGVEDINRNMNMNIVHDGGIKAKIVKS